MSIQNDAVVEHSSVESMNSLHTQSGLSDTSPLTLNPGTTPISRPEGTSSQHTHKKVKCMVYAFQNKFISIAAVITFLGSKEQPM
jgi:hypothetical protein